LAPDPELPLPSGEQRGDAESLWLPLGPGGDDGETVGLDLQRTGGLLVVGPPGSGRSAALDAFTQHCVQAGAAVVVLADAPGAVSRSPSLATLGAPAARWPTARRLDRADADGLRAWTAGREGQRPLVVVADDLPSLPDPVADALAALAGSGAPLVLAAGTAVDLAASFRGPAVTLRRSRTALLLRPAAGDAELLGLRSPRTPLPPRPGAGWLLTPAQATRVQVARRRGLQLPEPGGVGGQSRSSAGPISWLAYQASS
jgi:DNA segregation ATPase FtsK/SpoIIIE, S-DNA-T family